MTNIVYIAQIVGTVSFLLLFIVKFFIAINEKSFLRSGRIAMLWTTIFIFFLFVLRVLQLFHIGTQDDLRIISGFSAVIPVVCVLIHLWLYRNSVIASDVLPSIQEAKTMLAEAKAVRSEAQEALNKALKKEDDE